LLSVLAQALLLLFFCVQVRNCFLFPVMPMRVVTGKSKPDKGWTLYWILELRAPMDDVF
jgi:hypothetical protein